MGFFLLFNASLYGSHELPTPACLPHIRAPTISESRSFIYPSPGQQYLAHIYNAPAQLVKLSYPSTHSQEATVEKQSASNQSTASGSHTENRVPYPHSVRSECQPQVALETPRRFKVTDTAPNHQSVPETKLSGKIVDLAFKLGKSEAAQRTLKKQEGTISRESQNISERLDFTKLALESKKIEVEMQAKEIEMLRKTNDQLKKKTKVLIAETQNAYFDLDWKTQIGHKQSQELENLRRKIGIVQRENEEWKSKYQSVFRSTQQDTYSMEQYQNALKNVLINNDLIIENLKGVQTDPEEKKKLMVGHNETLSLLRKSEKLNLRVQELEEKLKENGDSERLDYDFCEDSFEY